MKDKVKGPLDNFNKILVNKRSFALFKTFKLVSNKNKID